MLRAKELVAQYFISFSPRLGAFTVMDASSIHIVKIYPSESCSCPIRKACMHILAVKIGLRMEISSNDLMPQNLGVVRKQVRGPTRQKPGRKRPRPGDVSAVVPDEIKPKRGNTDGTNLEQYGDGINLLEQDQEDKEDRTSLEQNEDQELQLEQDKEDRTSLEQHEDQELQVEQDKEDRTSLEQNESKLLQLSDLLREISNDKTILAEFLEKNDVSFENIATSTPNSELRRDIRYSLEVWVPADKEKLFHNLNITEKNILQSKRWLNDVIIDSSMNLLQYQFPDLEGLQSCQLAHQLDFQRHDNLFIQIINRSPNDGGSHWLTVSNINCLENSVKVYDSAFSDLPHEEELLIASLVKTEAKRIRVQFVNVAMQSNGYDCGIYAIANATALAHGIDPSTQVYVPRLMREHLLRCLENKRLTPFPVALSKQRRKAVKKYVDVPLFCICHMPDTKTTYVYCDICSHEFHPLCVGLTNAVNESTQFVCPNCTAY